MIKDFYKILFCMIMFMISCPLSTYSEIVKQIEIKGNERIPNETIKMFSSVSVNDDINIEKINDILKANFTVSNLLNYKHTEIIGGPSIGRVALIRLTTTF